MKTVLAGTVLALFAVVPSPVVPRSTLRASTPSSLAPRPWQAANARIDLDKARDQEEARQHYQRGHEALHSEKYEVAEREFQESIRLDPIFELSRYGLGQTYMAMKRYPDAVAAFQKCRDVFHANNAADASDQIARDQRLDDRIKELEDQKRTYQSPGHVASTSASAGFSRSYLQNLDIQINSLKEARHRQATNEEPTPA